MKSDQTKPTLGISIYELGLIVEVLIDISPSASLIMQFHILKDWKIYLFSTLSSFLMHLIWTLSDWLDRLWQ